MPDTVLARSADLIPDRIVKFVWRQERSTVEWYTFYIVAPGERRGRRGKGIRMLGADRKYHGGWNGERLSGNVDTLALKKRHPLVYKWMLGVLKDVAS